MKYILITCDTEIGELTANLSPEAAFDIFVLGKLNNEVVGVKYINKLANEFDLIVNHFVDIYPPHLQTQIADLCYDIMADGHYVGLHTHPGSRYGRRFINEYNLNEQKEILSFGKDFFWKNYHLCQVTHRAGGYGADDNTIRALSELEFIYDSSFFYNNLNCHISGVKNNVVTRIGDKNDIIEVPVSTYVINRRIFGIELSNKKKYSKLDFRYGSNVNSILKFIDNAPYNSVIVLFLHSFNFLNLLYSRNSKRYIDISISRKLINDYYSLLSEIKKRTDCSCIKFDQIPDFSTDPSYSTTEDINIVKTFMNRCFNSKDKINV